MLEKLYELAQKGFSVSFQPCCPYFLVGDVIRIELHRDNQYTVVDIADHAWVYLTSIDSCEQKEFIVKTLDELEQDFYHEFEKDKDQCRKIVDHLEEANK